MLVFHGTGADDALIETLFDDGFEPRPRPWAHDVTGIEKHVFASTTQIGTRGGDPIAFAQRGAWKHYRAYVFVFDIAETDVHGAVPNDELERWWKVRSFASVELDHRLFALARERKQPIRELLRYRVKRTADGLCETPDAHTLVQFEAAYDRARLSEKARIARSYGLAIPEWFAEDGHYTTCMGCMHNLFEVDIEVPDIPGLAFHRGSWDRLDLTNLGQLLDATDRWLAHAGDPQVRTFEELQKRPAPPKETVPRVMWRDFVTADLAERMREPDAQVLLDHVPPSKIVGAIDVGTRDRLSSLVRPSRGDASREPPSHHARARRTSRAIEHAGYRL